MNRSGVQARVRRAADLRAVRVAGSIDADRHQHGSIGAVFHSGWIGRQRRCDRAHGAGGGARPDTHRCGNLRRGDVPGAEDGKGCRYGKGGRALEKWRVHVRNPPEDCDGAEPSWPRPRRLRANKRSPGCVETGMGLLRLLLTSRRTLARAFALASKYAPALSDCRPVASTYLFTVAYGTTAP